MTLQLKKEGVEDITRKEEHTNATIKLAAGTSHQNKRLEKDENEESEERQGSKAGMRCQKEKAAIGKARNKHARGKALFKYMQCRKGRK